MNSAKKYEGDFALQREESRQLQSQIDELVSRDARDLAGLDQEIAVAAASAEEARKSLRSAADGNQIYRLAASWYGVSTSNVAAEQLATARWVFSTFSAIAVALAGSIAALVYYSHSRVPGVPSLFGGLIAKIARACRAYYARKRRPLKVEVAAPERVIYRDGKEPPTIVEKEVVRFIDQIVLIPGWGIKSPIHINAHLQRNGRNRNVYPEAESLSNVTPLDRKVS